MIALRADRIGELLVAHHGVDAALIERALEKRAADPEDRRRLGEVLTADFRVDEALVAQAVAHQRGLPFLAQLDIAEDLRKDVRGLGLAALRGHMVLPLRAEGDWMDVAIVAPDDTLAIEFVEAQLARPARLVVTTRAALQAKLNQIFEEAENTAAEVIDEINEDMGEAAGEFAEGPADLLEATDEDAPIIRLVNRILFQAVRDRASDIHVEPMEEELVVRLRIDGILYPVLRPPKNLQASITSRVKIMAGMNIAEKRLPQDGRIRVRIAGRDIDIRASSLPTSHGERLVLRILDRSKVILDLEQLGFEAKELTRWRQLIERPHGIILVTGPTGSGKTTTLYASLSEINSPDKNIITIEDPVEYQLKGIGQMNVNPKIDLTFAAGLRTILRQDPDIILVGEIRDLETAEIAIQASLTGHLVFSTLHTNDAPGALTRLVDMGVEPFLVASSLLAVSGQRLVRRICAECREPVAVGDEALAEIGLRRDALPDGNVYHGAGCARCMNTGYRGRLAINELMFITDPIRTLIMQNRDATEIRRQAVREGMRGLREDGARKVALGHTTIEEVLRVTQEEVLDE